MKIKNDKISIKNSNIFKISFLIFLLFTSLFGFAQFDIPKVPKVQTSVYDYANLLSPSEKTQLEEKLIRYSDSTSTQIVIATILDLKNESIDVVSTKWAHSWGIGQAKEDNGVFILVSKNDRKISIRPGYGVEDRLVAGICGEIIRNVITPEFKTGNYYAGLDKGADVIIDVIKGKYKAKPKQQNQKQGDFPILPVIIVFIILIIIFSNNKRNGGGNSGNRGGGMDLSDIIILSSLGRNSGRFGGGFGGSSGGGFGGGGFGGGFGGGGFSGGGASGGW